MPDSILKDIFGYSQFLPLQKEIIDSVLRKKDTVALMPTGGGKSLCFQIPALKFAGLTVVVSPLISLMKDQVDALRANGVNAAFWNSSLSQRETDDLRNDLRAGKIKLLYVAPERFAPSTGFWEFLKSLDVSLFAIDEAHCISEWGHDFRKEYRQLKVLREQFPNTPIIALTATATPQVAQDIELQLALRTPQKFQASFHRQNLVYEVRPKQQAMSQLLDFLRTRQDESGIIYCLSRKDTDSTAEFLRAEGFSALPYHAGLSDSERAKNQERFIRDDVRIMVATIAFGMGIDKPDVRFVIHRHLPKNLEGYYQETGRAGRDGLSSHCLLFYSPGDLFNLQRFTDEIADAEERKRQLLKIRQMSDFAAGSDCRWQEVLRYFGEDMSERCGHCDNCLTPPDMADATVLSQKILSAIYRTGQRFGVGVVIDVLKGKASEVVSRNRLTELSVFGVAADNQQTELRHAINELVARGFIEITGNEYPVLKLTPKSLTALKERQKIELPLRILPKSRNERSRKKQAADFPFNEQLFQALRAKRRELAEERGVPPYVIFSDRSLQEMAAFFPINEQEFGNIAGVGSHKLHEFADIFLTLIRHFADENPEVKASAPKKEQVTFPSAAIEPPGERSLRIFADFKSGISPEAIAQKDGVKLQSIYQHLERLIAAGKITDIARLVPEPRFSVIAQVAEKNPNTTLSDIRNKVGEEYSWDEIRVVRAFLLAKEG